MKKELLFIAAAATMLTACVNTDNLNYVETAAPNSIDFETFVNKQTKAENSSATLEDQLNSYNTTFRIWGNKYVGSALTRTRIFGAVESETPGTYTYPGEVVTYDGSSTDALIGKWTYSPIRFWDRSATSYDFYAASPATPKSTTYSGETQSTEDKSWVMNDENKKISIANFRVSGANQATDPTNTTIAANKVMATVNTEDLMISTDITGYNDFSYATALHSNGVHLQFNHILSRLNIGFRKSNNLADYTVLLKSVKIFNMKSIGSFNEAAAITSPATLATGTQERWTKTSANDDKFTPGNMKWESAQGQEITQTVTTNKYQYVYEGLIIPQTVGYSQTILVSETVVGGFKIDGSNAVSTGDGTWSNPYIVIEFEIGKTVSETYTKIDSYKYYFNLADVFNGDDSSSNVDFCEGWQNTLNITLAPTAIKFDPYVYKWEEKFPTGDSDKSGELFDVL